MFLRVSRPQAFSFFASTGLAVCLFCSVANGQDDPAPRYLEHPQDLVAAPNGGGHMSAPGAPRAGSSIGRREAPDYQDPVRRWASNRANAASNPRQARHIHEPSRLPPDSELRQAAFAEDAPRDRYPSQRGSSTSVRGRQLRSRYPGAHRAAYEMPAAEEIMYQGEAEPMAGSAEELPMPGEMSSVMAPGGPTQYGSAPIGSMHGGSVHDGSMQYGSMHYGHGGVASGDCGCDGSAHGGDCGCHGSGGCGYGDCGGCNPCDDWYLGKDLTLHAGVHGFKGPVDGGQNGNFGFQEGFNWSSPFWYSRGIGFQLGGQAMQSDFTESFSFSDDRSQFFLTMGLFRRQVCGSGWQWGLVYDYLSDEFDEDFDVGQVRGEVSYLFRGHEFGFWWANSASGDEPSADSTSGILSYETVDQYAFFYRRRLMNGGEGRLWGGFTGQSDGIFGGDVRVPIACDWDLVGTFNYLAADESDVDGQFSEAWNIGINLVWYVCPEGALGASRSRYRPLMSVADNGTMVVNTLR
jgi:hypothetical protein